MISPTRPDMASRCWAVLLMLLVGFVAAVLPGKTYVRCSGSALLVVLLAVLLLLLLPLDVDEGAMLLVLVMGRLWVAVSGAPADVPLLNSCTGMLLLTYCWCWCCCCEMTLLVVVDAIVAGRIFALLLLAELLAAAGVVDGPALWLLVVVVLLLLLLLWPPDDDSLRRRSSWMVIMWGGQH